MLSSRTRRNTNEQNSLFPALGGESHGSALTVPLSLNIARRRTLHNVNVNFSRTSNDSSGRYAFVEDVAGNAGINGVCVGSVRVGRADPYFLGLTERPRHRPVRAR